MGGNTVVDVPWKVGAVVGVDDEIVLSVKETACDRHGVIALLLQETEELSEHHVNRSDINLTK